MAAPDLHGTGTAVSLVGVQIRGSAANQVAAPFRRLETLPGEEAQVNFGTGPPVIGPDGKRRRPW